MRLEFVEMAGFRGFREPVRLDFGSGFTVLAGRNGVGKSTVCDAIEFALTGEIDKYPVDRAASETLADYVWWRGPGKAAAHFVKVGFRSPSGVPFVVTRTRENGADRTEAQIEAALCHDVGRPEGALAQLCKTSIIRDEWIAGMSVDLTDTKRFDLVRSALGSVEGAALADRARKVLEQAEEDLARDTQAYERAREEVNNTIAALAQERDASRLMGDVAGAIRTLDFFLSNTNSSDPEPRLMQGRAALVALRSRVARLEKIAVEAAQLLLDQKAFDEPTAKAERERVAQTLQNAANTRQEAERQLELAVSRFDRASQENSLASSLSQLVEIGNRIGLHNDHCPLCAANRTESEFAAGLAAALARVSSLSTAVAAASEELERARVDASGPIEEHQRAVMAWTKIQLRQDELQLRGEAILQAAKKDGVPSLLEITVQRDLDREAMIELDRALLTLEASQAFTRVTALEARVVELQGAAAIAADRVARSLAAVSHSKAIEKTTRLISGEIIDEKLAQISPLLNELFQRLRPHAEWKTIDYNVRGQVRKFLSLRVGEDLNPQFVFSSGQRRAAGLAFLLSVYLARGWTRWDTLILDDPVQHIDDFRALHLVEVLAALRGAGRQIVCAVEDPDLADLLSRRLFASPDDEGVRYDIQCTVDGGVATNRRVISPLPAVAVRSQDLRVVG